MKKLLLLLPIVILGSCTPSANESIQVPYNEFQNNKGEYNTYTIVYDSCEYVVFKSMNAGYANQVLHKQNCKNH